LERGAGISVGSIEKLNDRSVGFDSLYVVAAEEDEAPGRELVAAVVAALATAQGWAPDPIFLPPAGDTRPRSDRSLIIWLTGQSVPDAVRESLRDGDWLIQVLPTPARAEVAVPAIAIGGLILTGTGAGSGMTATEERPQGHAALVIDAAGLPRVSGMTIGAGRWYQIDGSLVTSATTNLMLPELVFQLLAKGNPSGVPPVSSRQALPGLMPGRTALPPSVAGPNTLLLILAMGLLAVERLLARTRSTGAR
jgi:hypothetical protein